MSFTWGFVVIFILIIVPGLIAKRLYYSGEFSKQFDSGKTLLSVLTLALIPGFFLLTLTFCVADYFLILEVNIWSIISLYQDAINGTKPSSEESSKLNLLVWHGLLPFLGLLYPMSAVIGLMSGVFVRAFGLDTKLKLFKFSNHWFYLFTGDHAKLRKYKHLRQTDSVYLFTHADILIDTQSGPRLYTGFIVDYEIDSKNPEELRRVILRDAQRYVPKDDSKTNKAIPGHLFVVDCARLLNINLRYIYAKSTPFIQTVWPKIISYSLAFCGVLLLVFLFYRLKWVSWNLYTDYFELHWSAKIFYYLFLTQVIQLPNPFVQDTETKQFHWAGWKHWGAKIVILLMFYGSAKLLNHCFG